LALTTIQIALGSFVVVNMLRARPWIDVVPARERDAREKFEEIFELHYKRVYRLIYRMVRHEGDAADLTQETFVRIHRALPKLREEGASSAWVSRIATNVCVDFVRRRRRTAGAYSLDARPGEVGSLPESRLPHDCTVDPANVLDDHERVRAVRSAIDQLPTSYRTVILLHHIAGMRVDDVAETLGVPAGTVKSRLSRAREALRLRLAPSIP